MPLPRLCRSLSALALAGLLFAPATATAAPKSPPKATKADPTAALDPLLLGSLRWREVGPYRGGRSCAVTGIPRDRNTYYFGGTGGGVWKTTDGGLTWKNLSDGFFGGSIGAVAVSEWDPNVIYVGTGEETLRGNVSSGDGVWKSLDAGKTWKNVGLPDSRHIFRIRIHPRNPELVYVAAFGHAFGANAERGVYRSKDGGLTWEKVLFVNNEVGAADLAMDPTNPRILYASFWRARRSPWGFESGGPGSSLWKSIDGGDNWQELTTNPGLPKGPLGIIGITVSASQPDNLYAIVEAEQGGVFRSKDGGKTWTRTNENRELRQRAWYYSRIYADPADPETVYVVNVRFHRSKDGGKTFTALRTPHGDNHDLWIAPEDPLRMIESNDGGVNVSTDGGRSWTVQSNQPTAQIYRVSTDNAVPYRLLGGQQDNTALRIRSNSPSGGPIGPRDWEPTAGGESGYVVAKPDDPDLVFGGSYGGSIDRLDHRTLAQRSINVWPDDPMGWGAAELKYRFQWNAPLLFSPHDPNLLYSAGNVLFASRDGGASWQAISPDLTRNDKSKLEPSGGPITKDNTSVEYYCTIFAVAESPVVPGLLWTGSDDGLIHVSRDGGSAWANVTPKELPEWSMINSLEASPFDPGTVYVAATRYKLDDNTPSLWKGMDYGATWKRIDNGIDRGQFTRVVRADPHRRGLLYTGTERGVYVSFDDGESWQSLQRNLPVVPVTDLAVKGQDLVAATQGRGFWILDDVSPLEQMSAEIAREKAHLFVPRPSVRQAGGEVDEPPPGQGTPAPAGVVIHYWLAEAPAPDAALKLEILDGSGAVIRTFTRKPAPGAEKKDDDDEASDDNTALLPAEKGANRFVWDLLYPPAETFPGMILWSAGDSGPSGPVALPGSYQARLTLADWSATEPFTLLPDPRSSYSEAERRAQFDFVLALRDKLTEVHRGIKRLRAVKKDLDALDGRLPEGDAGKALKDESKALKDQLTSVEEELYQTKNKSPQDPLNFPIRLNDKLASLLGLAGNGDGPPTRQMLAVRDELVSAADAALGRLAKVLGEGLPALEQKIRDAGVPAVKVPEEKKKD
ncbi:MAG: glycosyl hydrolase [Thermoanaerobaculia bacterium]